MKIRIMLVLCAAAVALTVGVSTATAAPACGTVTSNTTLGSDCSGPLTVGASGITVDLGGHSVLCSGVPGVTGIDVGSWSNVLVENGSVDGCEEGVLADGGDSNQFVALTLTNNNVGFEVSNSVSTTIMRNKVTNSPFTGVLLFQTSGFVVHRNTVLDSGIGIFDNGGTNNVISLNSASRGVGISDVGILLNAKSDTVVRNSTVANGTGIWVSVPSVPPGANRLLANTSTDNNVLDMRDDAAGCDSNIWKANTFITANQPCIQ